MRFKSGITQVQQSENSIRSRLTTLVIVAIFGSVTIVTASSVWREISQYGEIKTAELESAATVFAYAISDHVREGDKTGTLEALRAISQFPNIDYVRVSTMSGETVAELGETVTLKKTGQNFLSNTPLAALTEKTSFVSVPIVNAGETVGVVLVHSNLTSLSNKLMILVWDALVAAIFAGGIGLLIALKMQRTVTQPIHNLAKVMNTVRTTGDFGRRAERISSDETGELVESFNEMLDQIQERDAKLLAHQQNLKKIVHQRTIQFEKAKETAEAANLAKSDFLATMSHEIRTPMNGMLVMAELLNSTSLAPRQKRYADVIVKSGKSLIAIINDILDFSKIEAGRLDLEAIPVNPIEVINEVIDLFWERATSSGIDLSAYVAPNVPKSISSDPIRLNQILSNLVNNALKFTERGSITVAAKMISGPNDQAQIEFSVTDTGVGIAPQKQQHIFDAFAQADQTTTRKFGGTGLGLAICTKIVESMNGTINVKSIEGRGSKFFFNFPTDVIELPREMPQTRSETHAVIAIAGSATPKNLARYLREAGINVHIIQQGSAIAQNMAYTDIIFGSPIFLDTFNKSVQGSPDQWVPARICISELGDSAPDRLLEAGIAEDLIIKPLSRDDVLDQIERILSGSLRRRNALKDATPTAAHLPSFSGIRVLAADDSAVNREVVREALTKFDLDPIVVSNGASAVEAAQSGNIDLIFMDCSMPGMDGFEATQAIRAWETKNNCPRVPIIALTAHVPGGDQKWREAGMDAYVTKPFTMASLAEAISAQLTPGAISQPTPPALQTHVNKQSPADGELFDMAALNELSQMTSGIGDDLVVRALDLFQEHSKEAAMRVINAIKNQPPAEIKSAAHALKSMSVNVGAIALGKVCSAIEENADNQQAYLQLAKDLRTQFSATHEKLPIIKAQYSQAVA